MTGAFVVGALVGSRVGLCDGVSVGVLVGVFVGVFVGLRVGLFVGAVVGAAVTAPRHGAGGRPLFKYKYGHTCLDLHDTTRMPPNPYMKLN